jgi:hypothetical protein
MNAENDAKAIVSVAEMARMCGLSRARFYQLANEGVFPSPIYNCKTRRPFFTEEMQAICLDVRRRNCGVNGRAVLFYSTRIGSAAVKTKAKAKKPSNKPSGQVIELVDGVRCLGLTTVTAPQVESAVRHVYPKGLDGVDAGTVLRAVFLHLRRQDSGGNVGRK